MSGYRMIALPNEDQCNDSRHLQGPGDDDQADQAGNENTSPSDHALTTGYNPVGNRDQGPGWGEGDWGEGDEGQGDEGQGDEGQGESEGDGGLAGGDGRREGSGRGYGGKGRGGGGGKGRNGGGGRGGGLPGGGVVIGRDKCRRNATFVHLSQLEHNTRRQLLGPEHYQEEEDINFEDEDEHSREEQESMEDTHLWQGPANNSGPIHYVINDGVAVPETAVLSLAAGRFFQAICLVAEDTIATDAVNRMSSNVQELMGLVISGKVTLTFGAQKEQTVSSSVPNVPNVPGSYATLKYLALNCHENDVTESTVVFQGLLNAMEFAANVQICMKDSKGKKKRFTIFTQLEADSDGTLDKWWLNRYYSLGLKASMLAGAGSVYFLALIAVARLRTTLSGLSGSTVCELAKALRCPDDSDIGTKVKNSIIPAVSLCRDQYPITGDLVFSDDYTMPGGEKGAQLNIVNISETDKFFDSLGYNAPVKPRDSTSWALFTQPISEKQIWSLSIVRAVHEAANQRGLEPRELLRLLGQIHLQSELQQLPTFPLPPTRNWDNTTDLDNMIIIDTQFDPTNKKNTALSYDAKSKESRIEATNKHRKWAKRAKVPKTQKECANMISQQLETGAKIRSDIYTILDTLLYDGKVVKINDKLGNMVAILFADMPAELSKGALDAIRSTFPNMIQVLDSSKEAGGFYSLHFSYYNRYAKKGTGTPSNADPSTIRRLGKNNVGTKVNIPRESKESEEWYEYKATLQEALHPLFEWISEKLKTLIPETFEDLL
ncbi:hypothetical protein EST38_g12702 [Candolleomyces aberdarensis]|uniref:Uncharacterized protein n=1 Tax=Candolleomyces aberdarensis TaxID=2316362 RepID=A0A4V1Q1X9_9AGAR|nr:hypothetical protein EST38_g12702 [Candolleomyces aberdarensis]